MSLVPVRQKNVKKAADGKYQSVKVRQAIGGLKRTCRSRPFFRMQLQAELASTLKRTPVGLNRLCELIDPEWID